MTDAKQLEIGDSITFRAVTRWSSAVATRVITGFSRDGRPLVRYGGWSDFMVSWDEILEE